MIHFKQLEERYRTDAAFNKLVNLTKQLLEEYGFMPSEIRDAQFLAQYLFEMGKASQITRTREEQEDFLAQIAILKQRFAE